MIMFSSEQEETAIMVNWEGVGQTVTYRETEERQEGDRGREGGRQRGAGNRWKEWDVSAKKRR